MREYDGQTVFQVSRTPLLPGVQLRRYSMSQYIPLIARVRSVLEQGPAALSRHLSAPEWQRLAPGPEDWESSSDDLKMMIVLESIFEQARLKTAPRLPSRMDCIFTWPSLESAQSYRLQYAPEGVIHRCRVLEGTGIVLDGGLLPPGIHLADLSLHILAEQVRAAQARAEKYWRAHAPSEFPELLILGRVEIMGLLTDS